MNTEIKPRLFKRATWIVLLIASSVLLSSCGRVNLEWKEEVELNNGQILIVKRTAKGDSNYEIGGGGGWVQSAMSVELASTIPQVAFPRWYTVYVPMLLDYQEETKTWSMVATFYYCDVWYRWGRPPLPYIEYQSQNGGAWKVVPLEQRLIGRRSNLLTGPRSGGEPDLIPLKDLKQRNKSAAPKYKTILGKWKTSC